MGDRLIRNDTGWRGFGAVLSLVPHEFIRGYTWFLRRQGENIPYLPYSRGNGSIPDDVGYPLARDAGIHSPAASRVRYREKRYAISVRSSNKARYEDSAPTVRGDGTWSFRYCAQDNDPSKTGQDYNGWLMSCLEDGVPVAVMTKAPYGGYIVWGLALIVSFAPEERMFTMQGPVGTLEELELAAKGTGRAQNESLSARASKTKAPTSPRETNETSQFKETKTRATVGADGKTHLKVRSTNKRMIRM